MAREVCEQPALLARNWPVYQAEAARLLAGERPRAVLFVARGSSDNAALFGRYLVEVALGVPASLSAPSVHTLYGARLDYSGYLAVGISQSGASPDVAAVLEAVRRNGGTALALTNDPASPVARAAGRSLELAVGPEVSVAATKTYTASLAAVYACVQALGGELPEPALPDDAWCGHCRSLARPALGPMLEAGARFVLARGYRFATAHETALKLIECALLPAKAYSSADFSHGPLAMAGEGAWILAYGGTPTGTSAKVELGPDAGDGPDAPLRDVFFGQWLAYEAALARGFDPDAPPRIAKVTQTW
jgi:glucosamine--fructose-6-phosphate aminotransferase (isomerizing)